VTSTKEVSRIQELIYELPIRRVMTSDVLVMHPDSTIRELKDLLRVKKISGTPVVEDGHLVGIVSLEDLIKALVQGDTDGTIRSRMSTHLVTVHADDSVVEAVKKFARYGVGRLPVLDDSGKLVGILTSGDITRGVLEALGLDHTAKEKRRVRQKGILDNLESDETRLTMRYSVKAQDFRSGGRAATRLKKALTVLGVHAQIIRRVSIAAYEAEMNLIIHSEQGGELVARLEPRSVTITSTDTGPGIPDVDQAMVPGYSTAPDWIRELGFGAGMGLANIRNCGDRMTLNSRMGVGTRLEISFDLPSRSEEDARHTPKEGKHP
jgi:CBS domain-containing protein/anti-sigma regulatory factor (Ser/Thr protein kinase)